MRMSFWMDYASSFCYIAFHKLTEAVKAVGIDQNKLDYNFRAFQLIQLLLKIMRMDFGWIMHLHFVILLFIS